MKVTRKLLAGAALAALVAFDVGYLLAGPAAVGGFWPATAQTAPT